MNGINSRCLDTNTAPITISIQYIFHTPTPVDTGHQFGRVYFGTLVDLDDVLPLGT